jgi:hypothetical protein
MPSVADPSDGFVTIHAFDGVRTPYHGGGQAFAGMAEYGAIQSFVSWLNHNESNVFFCLSTQRHDGTMDGRGKRKVGKGGRGARNARWLKALVLDLDVKPSAYASQRAALAQLLPFCEQHGLDPLIVSSGRGIHAYLVLNSAVTPLQWHPLAGRLIAAAQEAGLKCDVAVTRNPATLLRLPTSFNRKDRSNPLECRVLSWGGVVTVEVLTTRLARYPVRASALARDLASATRDPAIFPPRPPINGADHEQVRADLDHARIVTSVDLLRAACPVVADSDERGGDGDLEPLWFELAKLCHYVEGGRDYFHTLSEADSRYDEAATDRKYDTAEPQGWPACATIAAASTAAKKICEGCKFFGQGRSPVYFARTGHVNGTVNGHAHSFAATSDITVPLELPEGYHQLDDRRVVTPDGKLLFNNPIHGIGLISSPDGMGGFDETVQLVFPSGLNTGEISVLETSCSTFGSSQGMAALMGKGLLWQNTSRSREGMTDIITQIRTNRAAYKTARHGWVIKDGKVSGFAFGGKLFTPDGAQSALTKSHEWFTPTGDLAAWKWAANLWVGKGLIDHELVMATGFAAPLMQFTLVDGAVVFARSAGTGAGKSVSLETANSLWAHRDAVIQTTTINSLVGTLAEMNNLPVCFDEMVPANNKYDELILTVASGKEKRRYTRQSKQMAVRKSKTLLVAAANASLVQETSNGDTNAQAARVFEIPLTYIIKEVGANIPDSDRLKAKQSMEMNFGVGGMVFGECLGRHHEGVAALMSDTSAGIKQRLQLTEEDRYWLAVATAIYVGATLARKLDLIAFDTAAMYRRLLELVRQQKTSMADMRTNADDADMQADRLAEFLNENLHAIIRTDIKPSPGKKQAIVRNASDLTNVREYVARIALEDRWMLVSAAKVAKWCRQRAHPISPLAMKAALIKAGHCGQPKNRRSLSAQCSIKPSAEEYLLEFDLNLPINQRFLPQ